MLVDRQIKELADTIFTRGYSAENVRTVSYDISVSRIYAASGSSDEIELEPGEFVMIETDVAVSVPDNMVISVGQRNSRIRMGLLVDGPKYFPGHKTNIYVRAINLSQDKILLRKGDGIAQLFFQELAETPLQTYDQQENNSFNQETVFRGLGNCQNELGERITQSLDSARERLENQER